MNYYDIELPIPKPRTDRLIKIPKIKELNKALKGGGGGGGMQSYMR